MRFKYETLLGLQFRKFEKDTLEKIVSTHVSSRDLSGYEDADVQRQRVEETVRSFLTHKHYKDFFISKPALEMCEHITIRKDFNFKMLEKVPDQCSTFMLDDKRFYRVAIQGDGIINCFHFSSQLQPDGNSFLQWSIFKIHIHEGYISTNKDVSDEIVSRLIQILIFMHLCPTEELFLPAGKKLGTKKTGTYKNDTAIPFTVVTANWNKIVIRTDGFPVKGHIRMQACGPQWSEHKPVWIDGYEKSQYVRLPRKEE